MLDVQPGLTQVLRESDGSNTNHYIHSPRGIHAMNDGSNWSYVLQDGLGSVRAEIAQNVVVNGSQSYAPYGEAFGASGVMSSPFAFTGEPLDGNGLQYHRARYYAPEMGVWASLDPAETPNRYAYARGRVINRVDPTGLFDWSSFTTEPGDCLYGIAREMGISPEDNPQAVADFIEAFKKANNFGNNSTLFITDASQCPANAIGCPSISNPWIHPNIQVVIPTEYWYTASGEVNGPIVQAYYGEHGRFSDCRRTSVTVTQSVTPTATPTNTPTATYTPSPTATNTPSPTATPKPPGATTIIGGYVEGVSGEGTLFGVAGAKGREIVFNFATFESAIFTYGGLTVTPVRSGAGASYYVGHVENFSAQYPWETPFLEFERQYLGEFQYVRGEVDLPWAGTSVGGVRFASPEFTPNGVWGHAVYVSGGLSFGKPELLEGVNAGAGQSIYDIDRNSRKSYIDRDRCFVKIEELVSDIMIGRGDPIGLAGFSLVPVMLGRINAVESAIVSAAAWKLNYPNECSCKQP